MNGPYEQTADRWGPYPKNGSNWGPYPDNGVNRGPFPIGDGLIGPFPNLPAGFAFLIDDSGNYIVDDDRAYLIVEI